MHDLICFGEITRDTIGSAAVAPVAGSASILDGLSTSYGGRAANVATFFALQAGGAALVSAAGEDFVESGHRDSMESRGVDCSQVLIETGRPTPQAFMFHTGEASQTYFFRAEDAAADAAFAAHVRSVAAGCRARCLYCTSGHQELNLHLLTHLASELKVYAPGQQVFHYPAAELVPFLDACDTLFLNAAEAEYLYRTMALDAAALDATYRLRFHVVTRGRNGCTMYTGSRRHDLPGCPSTRDVDPTGAGDAFAGTFLAEYLRTGDLVAAGALAAVVASFIVEQRGCQEGLPAADAVRRRLEEYTAGVRSGS